MLTAYPLPGVFPLFSQSIQKIVSVFVMSTTIVAGSVPGSCRCQTVSCKAESCSAESCSAESCSAESCSAESCSAEPCVFGTASRCCGNCSKGRAIQQSSCCRAKAHSVDSGHCCNSGGPQCCTSSGTSADDSNHSGSRPTNVRCRCGCAVQLPVGTPVPTGTDVRMELVCVSLQPSSSVCINSADAARPVGANPPLLLALQVGYQQLFCCWLI
jgi:hypothetical protein